MTPKTLNDLQINVLPDMLHWKRHMSSSVLDKKM